MIKNIKITDFGGVASAEYSVSALNCFIGNNGAGKTSVLSAIRFGLTGSGANSGSVRTGAKTGSVTLTFDDGSTFERCISASGKGAQSVFINGKKAGTLKVCTEWLENKLGYHPDILSQTLNADALMELGGKEFNNLLMSIMPVRMKYDTLVGFINEYAKTKGRSDLSEKEKNILKKSLPDQDVYDMDALKACYEDLYSKRRALNSSKKGLEQAAGFDLSKIEGHASKASLEDRKQSLNADLGKAQTAAKVRRALEDKEKYKETVKRLSSVKKPDSEKTEAEIKKVENVKAAHQANITKMNAFIAEQKSAKAEAEKILKRMGTGFCPLSTKKVMIPCSTDLSDLKSFFETTIINADKYMAEATDGKRGIRVSEEQIAKCNHRLEELRKTEREETEKWNCLVRAKAALADIEKTEQQIAYAENLDPDKIRREITQVNEELRLWSSYEAAVEAQKKLSDVQDEIAVYEFLVPAFDGKGIKTLIIAKALESFEKKANTVAEMIRPGFNISIRPENGITLYARFHEEDDLVVMNHLSSGEKLLVVFLFINMIRSICKTDVIILDNLDRLDKTSLSGLLGLFARHPIFGNIFCATVDHEDTAEVLETLSCNYSGCVSVIRMS